MVGKLNKAMYGTRDAPVEWQAEVGRTMTGLGFVAVRTTPCLFSNPRTKVQAVIHVDDIMATGPKATLT